MSDPDDGGEIHFSPSVNARLPFSWDCHGCSMSNGFGRFSSLSAALEAKAAHRCSGLGAA